MLEVNNELIVNTQKQLKRINIIYILSFVAGGLLLIPLVNTFLGIIMAITVFLGLLIYLYKEVKKHYRDNLLLIAIAITVVGFILNVIQIKIARIHFGEQEIPVLFIITSLCIYFCILSAYVLLGFSAAKYKNEYKKFTTAQLYSAEIPYESMIQPAVLDENIVYEQRDRSMKDFLSFIIRAIVMIFIYFAIMNGFPFVVDLALLPFKFIMRAVHNQVSLSDEQFSLFVRAWANVYIQTIFVISGCLLFFKELRYIIKKTTKSTIALILIGYGLSRVIEIAVTLLLLALKVTIPKSGNQADLETMQKIAPVAMILAAVVLAPITEEFVFRQGLAEGIYRLLGKINLHAKKWIQDIIIVIGIILSGSLFGFIHVMQHGDYIAVIPYAVSGIVYTAFYFYSGRNVVVTIGIHMLNNLLATIFTL